MDKNEDVIEFKTCSWLEFDNYMEIIGGNIKYFREYYGYSKKELADKIGVSERSIDYWEKGERTISAINVVNIALALKVPTDDLLFPTKRIKILLNKYNKENEDE